MWRWSGSWTGKAGTMVMRSPCHASSGACPSTTGCTDGAGDAGCACQGPHTSSPVALGLTPRTVSARRTGVSAKVTRAASLSHAIAGAGTVDTRSISAVVQYGRARGAVARGSCTRKDDGAACAATVHRRTSRDASLPPSQWSVVPAAGSSSMARGPMACAPLRASRMVSLLPCRVTGLSASRPARKAGHASARSPVAPTPATPGRRPRCSPRAVAPSCCRRVLAAGVGGAPGRLQRSHHGEGPSHSRTPRRMRDTTIGWSESGQSTPLASQKSPRATRYMCEGVQKACQAV